jgi:hypothetical protein
VRKTLTELIIAKDGTGGWWPAGAGATGWPSTGPCDSPKAVRATPHIGRTTLPDPLFSVFSKPSCRRFIGSRVKCIEADRCCAIRKKRALPLSGRPLRRVFKSSGG